jgi:hypothetical protein
LARQRNHISQLLNVNGVNNVRQAEINTLLNFIFCAFSYNNYIFNFPNKCTCTIGYLYCLLSISYMFWHSLHHPQGELFSEPPAHCKVVTVVELQTLKLSYVGFLQCCLQLLKQCCLIVMAYKFFKILKTFVNSTLTAVGREWLLLILFPGVVAIYVPALFQLFRTIG